MFKLSIVYNYLKNIKSKKKITAQHSEIEEKMLVFLHNTIFNLFKTKLTSTVNNSLDY